MPKFILFWNTTDIPSSIIPITPMNIFPIELQTPTEDDMLLKYNIVFLVISDASRDFGNNHERKNNKSKEVTKDPAQMVE